MYGGAVYGGAVFGGLGGTAGGTFVPPTPPPNVRLNTRAVLDLSSGAAVVDGRQTRAVFDEYRTTIRLDVG